MPPIVGITADFDRYGPRRPRAFLYATYFDALRRGGAVPVLLPAIDPPDEAALDTLLERLDGVVFSGGDDIDPARYGRAMRDEVTLLDPRREAFELALAARALARGCPVLGLCNGIQTINVARGGTLVVHLEQPGVAHKAPKPAMAYHAVEVEDGSALAGVFGAGRLRTNSFHHQAVDEPGDGVRVVARSADGVIEAVEVEDHPFALGVQWHPELMGDAQRALFARFAEVASA